MIKDAEVSLFHAVADADPAHYVRGQYDGYLDIDGVDPESTTETYAALRLEIENWRWAGVPFFIRTGKRLKATQTELRLVFKHAPNLGFKARHTPPEPNQLVVKLDPSTGIRLTIDAHRADVPGTSAINLDMEFATGGWRGAHALRGAPARRHDRAVHALHAPGRRRGAVAHHAAAARRTTAGPPLRTRYVGPGGRRQARRRARPLARAVAGAMSAAPKRTRSRRSRALRRPRRSRRSPSTRSSPICHTGALVAPDGAIDWLCVPRFDSPSVFGSLLDREAGFFRLAPFGINHPTARAYVPGTNVLETTWKTPNGWIVVREALTLGPWDQEDEITPHTRPPADDDADHMLVRTVECIEGSVEVELVCEPVFDYGRTPAEWTLVDGGRQAADATGAGQTIRLRSDLALGVEGDRVRARHVLKPGDRAYCALSWAKGLAAPDDVEDAEAQIDATTRFWRVVARTGADPRPSVARPDPALRAHDQGPDLHADRRHGGRADDLAPRDARRRAQLGLPLHLDPRHDLHPAGAPLPQPELGGRRVHAVRRRRGADRGRVAADHVRDRRPSRLDRVDPRRPDRLCGRKAGADRERGLRPASERRVRRGAGLDPDPQPA